MPHMPSRCDSNFAVMKASDHRNRFQFRWSDNRLTLLLWDRRITIQPLMWLDHVVILPMLTRSQ